ncbi:MAG: helicase C-terminal domain-containing protein [Candidatus Pacearchaeota archaeon]
MWSLYRKKGDFEEEIKPLVFSNGKNQKEIVEEIIKKFKEGKKIIFIKGVCGSGKSAIALNIAKNFKKTSIVVPIKSLQEQYEEDYTEKKFLKKTNNEKLKISVIKGRNNFYCKFCECNADERELPCNIEIDKKNEKKIREFIKNNLFIDKGIKFEDIKRISVASVCPYWSPILPFNSNSKIFEKAKKREYLSVSEKNFYYYQKEDACDYYGQYKSYLDSDVIIFNSMKYLIEIAIGRKPKTELDIIDECDAFLDEFANQKKIDINKLLSSLYGLINENHNEKQKIKEIIDETLNFITESKTGIERLSESKFFSLFKKIIENNDISLNDEDNYFNSVLEACRSFEGFEDESYVSSELNEEEQTFLGKRKKRVTLNLVSTNLSSRLKEIIKQTDYLILMSGTLHSERVLKDIFGLKDFEIIEAETENPGEIKKIRTGFEKNCKHENLSSGKIKREEYLKALEECVKKAIPPVLVHVSSFFDLPNEKEKKEFNLTNLITREDLIHLQKNNKIIDDFKKGSIDCLYTTKCSRGIDFPGEQCNSIIITKFPYPDVKDLFWEVLKIKFPERYFEFYMDKARRELIQKVFRGVRFKGDKVFLLSPDSRVLDFNFKKI